LTLELKPYLLRLVVFGIAVMGYSFVVQYYLKGYLTLVPFTISTIALALLLLYIALTQKIVPHKSKLPEIDLKNMEFTFPLFVFVSAILEALTLGHVGFLTATILACELALLLFSRPKASTFITASLLITLIAVLYGGYTPTFGNDTWRDATQALQIIERGGLTNLTIDHPAYPLPVVPILYATYSIATGLNTLWSSSIIGLVYLVLISLWIYIVVKRSGLVYPHLPIVLLHTVPLIIMWSVWFVPQAYAALMSIPVLFLDLKFLIVLIFGAAMVFGHGGQSLWVITMLALMVLVRRVLGRHTNLSKCDVIKLIMISLLFVAYATYTTLQMQLRGSVDILIDAIITFLTGARMEEMVSTRVQRPLIAVLEYVPAVVVVILSIIAIIESDNTLSRLLVLASLTGLGVSFIGGIMYPYLLPLRYLSLGSLIVLIIFSLYAVQALLRYGRVGALYTSSLLLLATISFAFSGMFTLDVPHTVSPISGILSYSEAQILEGLAHILCSNEYLVDWRAGAYLGYKLLWIQPRYRAFYSMESRSTFILGGSFGNYVTPEYLAKFNGMLIFRKTALNMAEVFSSSIEVFLHEATHRLAKVSILYDASLIKIYYFH